MLGYDKTTKLLIRGVIENCLRHIYFIDHRIEFHRMNQDTKWYIPVEQLFDYAKIHPTFYHSEQTFDALSRLKGLYGELSAGVHGRSVSDLEVRDALEKLVYDQKDADLNVKLLKRCAECANFALSVFHKRAMQTFPSQDRSLLLRTMPSQARRAWADFEEIVLSA
jgi:hypothetical protein